MRHTYRFPIVAVGASAGGLKALEGLFSHLPPDTGLAFVVIVHQPPQHHTLLPELLSRFASVPVDLGADRMLLEPNRIYVMPPGRLPKLKSGRLRFDHPGAGRSRHPIDYFMHSLAEEAGRLAAGIVLSGTGNDGSAGAVAISEAGGLTLAQGRDGSAPAQEDMPNAAIAAGGIDEQVPVEAMGERLKAFAALPRPAADVPASEPPSGRAYGDIYRLLAEGVGHDFSGYKPKTFQRRVQRRMQALQIADLDVYAEHLRVHKDEVHALFQELLIGVTQFFRDPAAFEALETLIIPRLFDRRTVNDTVRVWVSACASGEEAYSIAILLQEYADRLEAPPKLQIFATDIDETALATAREGRYAPSVLDNVSAARLKRFFVAEDQGYQLGQDVREICRFTLHDVLSDPPFSRLDLVSCRNLLIYFGPDFQRQAIPAFHFALNPGGFLFLGVSETIGTHTDLFTPVDKKHRLFRRRDHVAPQMPRVTGALRAMTPAGTAGAMLGSLRRAVDMRIMERFAPAHVVVNREGNVLHFSAHTGKYLEQPSGSPNRNLLSMARKGLRLDLHAALREATETLRAVVRHRVAVEIYDRMQFIDLMVEPLGEIESDPLFIVVFQDLGSSLALPADKAADGDGAVGIPEQELREMRERLQLTVEEYEATVEELRSSNEELQSINEELKSTNEEMETSKEELQSVNEELQAVNSELSEKIEELDRAHADLSNLFENIEVATIFLDGKLVIRSFTPPAAAIFKLIDLDRGRPLTDIVSNLERDEDLRRDIQTVFDRGERIERRVHRRDGTAYYLLRIMPYRTVKSEIDGVVVTFVDVTRLIEAETRHRVLAAELDGRVGQVLTEVQQAAADCAGDAELPGAFTEVLRSRLESMRACYEVIARAGWEKVVLGDILAGEIAACFAAFRSRIAAEGPPVLFDPDHALVLAGIFHDLLAESTRSGALAAKAGRVVALWEIVSEGEYHLSLVWRECDGEAVPAFGAAMRRRIEKGAQAALSGRVAVEMREDGRLLRLILPLG